MSEVGDEKKLHEPVAYENVGVMFYHCTLLFILGFVWVGMIA